MSKLILYLVFQQFCFAVFGEILIMSANDSTLAAKMPGLPALFGPDFPPEGISGMLLLANPAQACGPIRKPPFNATYALEKWIVLITHSSCLFETNVRFAQSANYAAAVIYNLAPDAYVYMTAKNSTGVHIPSIFVTHANGVKLQSKYANENYYLVINSEVPDDTNGHIFLCFTAIASILGVLLILVMLYMVIKLFKNSICVFIRIN